MRSIKPFIPKVYRPSPNFAPYSMPLLSPFLIFSSLQLFIIPRQLSFFFSPPSLPTSHPTPIPTPHTKTLPYNNTFPASTNAEPIRCVHKLDFITRDICIRPPASSCNMPYASDKGAPRSCSKAPDNAAGTCKHILLEQGRRGA